MELNSILISDKDNVVTMTKALEKGNDAFFSMNGPILAVKAIEDIPIWNKIAIRDIASGECVVKYGESIGIATEDILTGHLVSDKNIKSVQRDYKDEYIAE